MFLSEKKRKKFSTKYFFFDWVLSFDFRNSNLIINSGRKIKSFVLTIDFSRFWLVNKNCVDITARVNYFIFVVLSLKEYFCVAFKPIEIIMPQYDETFLSYHADIERKGLRSYHPNKKNRKLFLSQHVPQLICHSIYELIEKCESGFSYK